MPQITRRPTPRQRPAIANHPRPEYRGGVHKLAPVLALTLLLARSAAADPTTSPALPDLTPTDVFLEPKPGAPDVQRPGCVLKNIGAVSTPRESQFDIAYDLDGQSTIWSRCTMGPPIPPRLKLKMPPTDFDTGGPWRPTPGVHVLTVRINDRCAIPESDFANNVLARSINVGPAPVGLLTYAADPAPLDVDLSAEGQLDWMHFGGPAGQAACRKAGAHQLGSLLIVGHGPMGAADQDVRHPTVQPLPGDIIRFNWTGGEPPQTQASTSAMMWVAGRAQGWKLTAPASTEPRRLRIYVAAFNALGRLNAALSDGSSPPIRTSLYCLDHGPLREMLSFDYRTATPGQTLTITWTLAAEGPADAHPLRLGAATLAQIKK